VTEVSRAVTRHRSRAAPASYARALVLAVADASEDIRWLVLNAEAWTYLDATAIDVLAQLHSELAKRGIVLCVARLKGRQREIFEETGLTARIGRDRFFPTVRAAVAAFEESGSGVAAD
jgi:SulP family sulfate permease